MKPCTAIITPFISREGNHDLSGNSVLSYEVKMCSTMLGEDNTGLGDVIKFGEHAVKRHIITLFKKRKAILHLWESREFI